MNRLAVALAALSLTACTPAGFQPVAWDPPAAPAFAGALAPNQGLAGALFLAEGQLDEPEDVAADEEEAGTPLYTGLPDGRIMRLDWAPGAPTRLTPVVKTSGVPLGLRMAAGGRLLACVGGVGVVQIETHDPRYPMKVLASAYEGRALHLLNDLDVAKDGTVYFTESSDRRYDARGYGPLYAAIEAKPEGSLFAYTPATGRVRKLADGLYFANGVAVMEDQASVLVVETARYQISRVWVAGPKAGTRELFAGNLPGIADGIRGDGRGRYWVAMNGRRSPIADYAGPRPWLRSIFAALPGPALLQIAVGEAYGLVVALGPDGRIARSLQDGSGRFVGGIANAKPYGDKLYLGTKWGHHIGVLQLPL